MGKEKLTTVVLREAGRPNRLGFAGGVVPIGQREWSWRGREGPVPERFLIDGRGNHTIA